MSNLKKNSVKIDLDFSDNNSAVSIDDLVQQRCYESLERQIENDLSKVIGARLGDVQAKIETYPPGSGLVYFIDGTRGAGKSTFLQATYEALPKKNTRLAQLSYIDPSRIEDSEIILLGILKSLADIINSQIKKSVSARDEPKYIKFRSIFKKMAGGLSLFSREYHQLQYLDPELFLDHGLERAGHSKELRQNLQIVLSIACEILEVDALILVFDDADTKASHARAVLECIRNYLDTPSLVILVTGDIELYSLMVRDHFFDSLGHSKFDVAEDRRRQRIRMVDHLEDQYLLKLFPIRRRLQLRPLWNLLETRIDSEGEKLEYFLTCDAWKTSPQHERDPNAVIEELLRRGLRIKDSNDVKLYREFLLKQPLRSVLQVLSRCAPYLVTIDSLTAETSQSWNDELSEALRESLRAMALGSLYKFGVDVDSIAAHELPALIDAVFELVNQDGDPDTAAYLRPQPSKEDLKVCFPALAADVAGLCAKNPAALIQYMLAGPGSVSLFGLVLRRNNGKIKKESLSTQFKQYMGTGRKEDALNWARHATAIIASPHKSSPTRSLVDTGIIGLNKERPKADSPPDFVTISRAIKACKQLPVFALSLVDVSGSSNRTYASIFNILGLISRLLYSQSPEKLLTKPYPPLSISCPEWEGGGTNLEDDTDDPEKGLGETDSAVSLDNLSVMLKAWLSVSNKNIKHITPSSILLGKIWTRLYFSLEKVSDALRSRKELGPASVMQMFALCVINAFLVEEAEHHLADSSAAIIPLKIDRGNPLTSADGFIEKKIPILASNHTALPLTYLVATCPLILGLLKYSAETQAIIENLISPLGEISGDWKQCLCSEDNWNAIEKTFIAGRWKASA